MSQQILISRDGQQFGPYSIAELQQHIAAGMISPEDQAWIGGGQIEWQPLSALLGAEVLGAPSLATPPPPPPPASPVAGEVQPSKIKKGAKRTGLNQPLWDSDLPRWRKVLNLTFIILIVISVIAVYYQDPPPAQRTSTKPRVKKEIPAKAKTVQPVVDKAKTVQPVVDVNIVDIIEAYKSNPLAGDQQFKGKRIRVTGIVKGVSKKMISKGYYAGIQPPHNVSKYSGRVVTFETADDRVLSTLMSDDVVTIIGECIGEDKMGYARLINVTVERKASMMEPIPGTVVKQTDDGKVPISADDPVVRRAAELYVRSLEANPIIKDAVGSLNRRRFSEIILIETGARHYLLRVSMFGLNSSDRIEHDYAFIVVEKDGNGEFVDRGELQAVAHCGSKPNVRALMSVKRANGWTSNEGWPQ